SFLREGQLNADRPVDAFHLDCRKRSGLAYEPLLARGGQLIRHRFALLTSERDVGLARVETPDVARQRHDLHTIEVVIGRIVAHDDRRPLLPDLTAHRW